MPRSILPENTIANKRPWLLAEWNYGVNPSPDKISVNSQTKFLWTCAYCGNSWEAKPCCHKTPGCPECRKKITSRRRSKPKAGHSLADVYPELKCEWDEDANSLKMCDVAPHARYRASWICSTCGEHYKAWVYNRTCQGSGCPNCKIKSISEKNSAPKPGKSIAEVSKALASEWHPKRNGSLTPSDVAAKSGKDVWWLGKCGHEWLATPIHRLEGTGCPYCAGKMVLRGFNDMATLYPALLSQWDGDESREYTPYNVTPSSGKYLGWVCPDCGKHYEMKVINKTARGYGCPHCHDEARDERIASLGETRRKSHEQFVEEAKKASPDIEILGTYIDSKHQVKARCKWCNNITFMFPGNILRGGGCMNCMSMNMTISEDEFVSRIAIASPYTKLVGGYVKASEKALFQCTKCGERWATVGTSVLRGSGCPRCNHSKSFPETAIYYYVSKAYPDARQNVRGVLENAPGLELDVWIPSRRAAIEYDGERWHTDEDKDSRKEMECFDAGISLIRVREPKCVSYQHTLMPIIMRRTSQGYPSLNDAIREVLRCLDVNNIDVDTQRDAPDINLIMDPHCYDDVDRT